MNEPSQSEWAELYNAAVKFQQVSPWEWMSNDDFFAVENPNSGELGYCSILGAGHEEYGLGVFLGDKGLREYVRMMAGKDKPEESMMAPKLGLLFVSRGELYKKDLDVIRSLNLTFRGKNAWPLFRSEGDGYLPWFMEKDETIFMAAAITQSLEVSDQVSKGKLRSLEYGTNDSVYVRRLLNGNWQGEWQKLKMPKQDAETNTESIGALNETTLELLRNRKLIGCWQLDMFMLPALTKAGSGRPYYPLCFLVVDGDNGVIVSFEVVEPWISLSEKRSTFLKMLEKSNQFPQEIWVKSKELRDIIQPMTYALGITTRIHSIGFLEKAKKGLSNYIS